MTNDLDWGQRGQYPQESHGRLRPRNAQEAQRYDPRAHQQRISGPQNAPQGQPWPQRGPGLPPFPGQQQPAPQVWQPGYGRQPYMPQPQYAPPPASLPPSARPRPVSAPRKLPPYPAHLRAVPLRDAPAVAAAARPVYRAHLLSRPAPGRTADRGMPHHARARGHRRLDCARRRRMGHVGVGRNRGLASPGGGRCPEEVTKLLG